MSGISEKSVLVIYGQIRSHFLPSSSHSKSKPSHLTVSFSHPKSEPSLNQVIFQSISGHFSVISFSHLVILSPNSIILSLDKVI
jgi:hypothetical protein